jgi:hypothetical protein
MKQKLLKTWNFLAQIYLAKNLQCALFQSK